MEIEIFICYAPEDEIVLKELLIHLGALRRQKDYIRAWHNREISPGTEWSKAVDKHLNTAQVILVLVSQYSLNSDYCYFVEMEQALERHMQGKTRVIPVLVRPVYWKETPFAKLQALPSNHKPILGAGWHSLDEAFFNVAEGIRKAIEDVSSNIVSKREGTGD